jgi:lysophospholipase L1-like esterase
MHHSIRSSAMTSRVFLACSLLVVTATRAAEEAAPVALQFVFGAGKVTEGYQQVLPTSVYSPEAGFGFEPKATLESEDNASTDSDTGRPPPGEPSAYFSVAVPEGNYKVTVVAGDPKSEAVLTVKSETRRLMIDHVKVPAGKFGTFSFVANVHRPKFAGGSVSLKGTRESVEKAWNWDDKLTLEFSDSHPAVYSVRVEKVDVPTIFVMGDSTVTDQFKEPWNSWGQMFPRWFKPDIAVANFSESGESLKSVIGEHRFEKVFSQMRPGDYLFVQFGHNDQKDTAKDAVDVFKKNLGKMVDDAKAHGGTVVLVTPMERLAGVNANTLKEYPDAIRAVAGEKQVALVELHDTTQVMYKAMGTEIKKAFQDGTHNNNFGSYETSQCVVKCIQEVVPELAKHIVDDFKFDPAHPDSPDSFHVPRSTQPTPPASPASVAPATAPAPSAKD